MRNIRIFAKAFGIALVLTFVCSMFTPAEAALSDRFNKKIHAAPITVNTHNVKQPAAAHAQAEKTKKNTQPKITTKTDRLPKKFSRQIIKEHYRFIEAFVNAEMAHRYYYGQIFFSKKELKPKELEAMQFELKHFMKELSSSAERYARNIRIVMAEMPNMDESERTFYAKLFGLFTASPACAADLSSLAGLENKMTGLAGATANVGYTNIHDLEMAKASFAKTALVATCGVAVLTTGGLAVGGLVGGAALAATATTTAGALGAGALTTVGIVSGGLGTVEASISFIDAVFDTETDTKMLHDITVTTGLVSAAGGAATAGDSAMDVVKTVIDFYDVVKDDIIKEITNDAGKKPDAIGKKTSSESGSTKAPGADAVNAVEKAKENAGENSNDSNGGNGGHC